MTTLASIGSWGLGQNSPAYSPAPADTSTTSCSRTILLLAPRLCNSLLCSFQAQFVNLKQPANTDPLPPRPDKTPLVQQSCLCSTSFGSHHPFSPAHLTGDKTTNAAMSQLPSALVLTPMSYIHQTEQTVATDAVLPSTECPHSSL